MKKLTVFSTAMIALALSGETMAQRGSRYNPGGGGGSGSSSSSSSSSSPRGPSYNPGGGSSSSSSSSRPSPSSGSSSSSSSYRPSPSSSSSSSSSSPRGPSYNPGGSSSSSSSTPRGPSYNPRPSSGSSSSTSTSTYRPTPSSSGSSSSSTTPRGPSYNPTPSTSTSTSTSSTPRGPSYNPTPSSSTSTRPTPTYTPSPSTTTTSTTPRGPRYNPSPDPTPSPSTSTSTSTTPRGPRYNPDPTPTPGPVVVTPTRPTPIPVPNTGSVRVPRGPRYNPPGTNTPAPHRIDHVLVRRTIYTHVPHTVPNRVIVYRSARDYHLHISRHYIYYRWIQEPVIWTYTDGYWEMDNYPYYVDNGYRYRYNPVETCKYDLVDGADYTVVRQFEDACNVAFDRCAVERDNLNTPIGMDRFFCAESVDDDLVVEDRSEYNPLPTEMSDARRETIESYLRNKTLIDIFNDGREGLGKCKIDKRFLKKCKYMVRVDGTPFPDPTGAVCSATENAAPVGCKESDQKGNAGCILEKAILQGLCHE